MSEQVETMGDRIKARREYLRLSQEEVAGALCMSIVGYGHYERGRTYPTADVLVNLARVLGCSVSYLVGEQSEDDFQDREAAAWYNGTAPHLKPAARATLRALYEQTDKGDAA